MVIFVRVLLATTVLALGLLAPAVALSAPAANRDPTKAQIAAAISHAEHSRSLWATVNICNTKRYPMTLGVRGQMPDLGFPAWLSMQIQVNFYSKRTRRFVPVPKGGMLVRLGRSSHGLQQGGGTFAFNPHTGLLNARVKFIWRRSGKLLGQTTRRTTAGHPGADFGNPPRFSAKQCRIP
jgi:hypothetical protein